MSTSSQFYTNYSTLPSFVTKDGSTVRELMHPNTNGNKSQSVAEAIVQPDGTTFNHYHKISEEIYHITQGEGIIFRGGEPVNVVKGDTMFIPAGVEHYAVNTGAGELKILCIMTPPYTHEQTVLVNETDK